MPLNTATPSAAEPLTSPRLVRTRVGSGPCAQPSPAPSRQAAARTAPIRCRVFIDSPYRPDRDLAAGGGALLRGFFLGVLLTGAGEDAFEAVVALGAGVFHQPPVQGAELVFAAERLVPQ